MKECIDRIDITNYPKIKESIEKYELVILHNKKAEEILEKRSQKLPIKPLPFFKYNPHIIQNKIFENVEKVKVEDIILENVICESCDEPTNIVYSNNSYSEKLIDINPFICPWCISNGTAKKQLDLCFQDIFCVEGISDINNVPYSKETLIEILQRTPWYKGHQQEYWLSHCNEPCAFIAYVGWEEIKNLLDDFVDLKKDCESLGLSLQELQKSLKNGGSCQGYLFQCLHCKKYRLYFDYA